MAVDLLVTNCRVVSPHVIVDCNLAINSGVIVGVLNTQTTIPSARTVDAAGRYVLPGLIDTHLHLGSSGQSFASDVMTETRHAVTGGVTTLLPFVIHQGSYRDVVPAWAADVERHSLVDMKFHLIITAREQIAEIPRLASELGIKSFKAFMAYKGREVSPSGIQGLDDGEIFAFLEQVAKVPEGIAIVHCENMEIIRHFQQPFIAVNRQDTAAWSDSRPIFGELEAIRRVISYAQAAGVRLLIPHMGIGLGSEFLRRKVWGKAEVFTETCPHYLLFHKDMDLGVFGKVNPPLRDREQVEALWQRLLDGTIDVLGSDHCPFTRQTKGDELWSARPGIPGGTAMILPVLLSEGVNRRGIPIEKVVELTSFNSARIFGLYPQKGALTVGSDADLVIVDLENEVPVTVSTLNSVSDFSPYAGYRSRGWVYATIVKGAVVYYQGQLTGEQPRGQLLRATAAS